MKKDLKNISTEGWSTRDRRQLFYTSPEWRNLRAYKLSLDPFCEICMKFGYLKPAQVVDHVKDIKDEPDLRLEITNLTSLCKPCHDRKTMIKTMKNNLPPQNRKQEEPQIMKRKWKIG